MRTIFSAEFWQMVREKEKEGQRNGQAVFNTAVHFWPETARRFSSTTYDPFYRDERVDIFLERVADHLTGGWQ